MVINMKQNDDGLTIIIWKLLMVFITAILGIYLISPILTVFDYVPRTGNSLMDTMGFIIIPIAVIFILIYTIFKIFAK